MSDWDDLCARFKVSAGRDKHMLKCPVHNDSTASLSVKALPGGGVLLHCFAGCPSASVRQALGVSSAGAGSRRQAPSLEPDPSQRRIVAEYKYRDALGDVLAIKRRWYPKTFDWLSWDIKEQRNRTGLPASGQGALPLYNLPGVIAAASAGVPILVVEGEKDADNLLALGYCATTTPEGASGAASAYDALRWAPCAGASVYLLPDNDDPGREHARRVADVLLPIAAAVYRVDLDVPVKGDVSDWLGVSGRQARDVDFALSDSVLLTVETADERRALDGDLAEWFEERAGIREFDGGMPRADAERLARRDVRASIASLPAALRLSLTADDPATADALRRLSSRLDARRASTR